MRGRSREEDFLSEYKSLLWTPQESRFLLYGLRARQVTVTVNGHEEIRSLLPVQVLCAGFGFSRRAIYNQISAGRLLAVKEGRRWLVVDPLPRINTWGFAWNSVMTDRRPRVTQPNLRTRDVAKMLGISTGRIRELGRQGRLHSVWYAPARMRLYSISGVWRFVKSREESRDGRVERAQRRLAKRFASYRQTRFLKRLDTLRRNEGAE